MNSNSTPEAAAPGRTLKSISRATLGRDLTDADARNWKPQPGITFALRYGAGLTLFVQPSGAKSWRCRVQRDHVSRTISLGFYPAVSLKAARAARMATRLAEDPLAALRAERTAILDAQVHSFAAVAGQWLARKALDWTPRVRRNCEGRLVKHVYPLFGERPVAEVTIDEVEKLVIDLQIGNPARGIEPRPTMAVAIRQAVCGVLDYALAKRLVPFNAMRQIMPVLPKGAHKPRKTPSVGRIEDARAVLAAIERGAPRITPSLLLAHRLIALTGVRKMEALGAVWEEFGDDLDAGIWTIPATRMKTGEPHIVMLAPQAIDVIRAARLLYRGTDLVFPSGYWREGGFYDRSSLNDVMNHALRNSGAPRFVPHGWRSSFVTIMNERTGDAYNRILDRMIAHKPLGASSAADRYDNAEHLEVRRRLACQWADLLLDGAPTPFALIGADEPAQAKPAKRSNVIALRRPAA